MVVHVGRLRQPLARRVLCCGQACIERGQMQLETQKAKGSVRTRARREPVGQSRGKASRFMPMAPPLLVVPAMAACTRTVLDSISSSSDVDVYGECKELPSLPSLNCLPLTSPPPEATPARHKDQNETADSLIIAHCVLVIPESASEGCGLGRGVLPSCHSFGRPCLPSGDSMSTL